MENTKVAAALVQAQKKFAPALKTSTNPHFKSKYADLSACIEAVVDALNENGIFLTQQCSVCEDGVVVETVFIHESGEMLNCGKLHVPASKQDAQGYGSALTYARRYSLMAASGIAPEDDDGNAATKATKFQPKQNFDDEIAALRACGSLSSLQKIWSLLDKPAQHALAPVKDECKAKIEAADKAAQSDVPQ